MCAASVSPEPGSNSQICLLISQLYFLFFRTLILFFRSFELQVYLLYCLVLLHSFFKNESRLVFLFLIVYFSMYFSKLLLLFLPYALFLYKSLAHYSISLDCCQHIFYFFIWYFFLAFLCIRSCFLVLSREDN